MNKDSYRIYDTGIRYSNNTEERKAWREPYAHYSTFHRVLNMLRDEGFTIEKDAETARCIRKDYYIGRRGDLEVEGRKFPAGFEITFFQNVNIKNPNGGRYDFDKFQLMPYMIGLQYIKYMRKIVDFLNYMKDLDDKSDYRYKYAEDQIKALYVSEWHHEQTDMNFKLSDLDGSTGEPSYNMLDRDKKEILNGQIKYFRYWDGRIRRGKVYHHINNMWFVILDKYNYTCEASFYLFDLSPDDYLGRKKTPRLPKEYQERRKQLEGMKTKELINELKRRGVAAKLERK